MKILGMWYVSTYKYNRTILAVLYIALILWITVFSRKAGTERIFKGVFWEIQMGYWNNIIQNIVLFIPLGFLVGGKRAIIIGLLLTIGIEITQYVFKLGYCEVDDVINNTIGVVVGTLLYREYGKRIEQLCTRSKK